MNPGTPPPRGFDNAIATFLRTVQTHHVSLSQMADQKANVLIAASFVVGSMVVHGATSHGWTPELACLAGTSLISSFFAGLTLLPRAIRQNSSNPNPLFFGDFAKRSREEFHLLFDELLSADPKVIHAMVEDIYQLGCVLHRSKYRYLGYAYRAFLSGLCLTAVTAVWHWLI